MNDIIVKYREGINDKPDWWELVEPVFYVLSNGHDIYVPAGYVTDFASVPPILWGFIPAIGKYNRAALVHDYLYDRQFRQNVMGEYAARKFADDEFLRIANECNPRGWIRHLIMYRMVRLFGQKAWQTRR